MRYNGLLRSLLNLLLLPSIVPIKLLSRLCSSFTRQRLGEWSPGAQVRKEDPPHFWVKEWRFRSSPATTAPRGLFHE